MKKKLKISFCTVCMDRLHHLKKTLPNNISHNISYANLEYIVLNYNSKDGLTDWIQSEMSMYLERGILKYYSTSGHGSFLRSHAKNVVGKQATGDIICNVDADNFIGEGFAEYINEVFQANRNIYLAVDRRKNISDVYGRICLWRSDFWKIHGYDETMVGYGFEDYDLWNRLNMIGRTPLYIDNHRFLKSLVHDDNERIKNEYGTKNIYKIYIRHIDHASSELLYLFQNDKFCLGTITINCLQHSLSVDNLFVAQPFEYYNGLENNSWIQGKWKRTVEKIILTEGNGSKIKLSHLNGQGILKSKYTNPIKEYIEIEKKAQISELIMFYSQINNRLIMEKNKQTKLTKVNASGFGITSLIEIFHEKRR